MIAQPQNLSSERAPMGSRQSTVARESGNPQSDEERWDIVRQRGAGTFVPFVYAVKTTGIYCVPGCSSRLPRRHNVVFFDSTDQAQTAGFRACKRCRPDQASSPSSHADAIAAACRIMDEADETPSLGQLAAAVGYSPSHFHKLFKSTTGITPKAYAATRRANRVRANLHSAASVTDAVYASGYSSASRLYEESDEVLGMKPTEFQAGAPAIDIRVATSRCWLGVLLVAVTEKGICAIELGDDEETLCTGVRKRFPRAAFQPAEDLQPWLDAIVAHLDDPSRRLTLPLDIQGTAFQRQVWEALQAVPAGQTRTYAEIAQAIGRPTAPRAVARAIATNPIAVAIPCHRIVRTDGGLGGYRWGVERKQKLLNRESK